jgi:FlaA1/EpsC-like NDP-sugar epimerase
MPLLETAQRLVNWYRPHRQPYPIAWTGMAPGERLHEVLLSENEFVSDGPVTGLRLVDTHRQPGRLQVLPEAVSELRDLVRAGERERLRQRCLELAEALQ